MGKGDLGSGELQLVKESRLSALAPPGDRHEASGVHLRDGYLHVVFDDTPSILRLRPDWDVPGEAATLLDIPARPTGYEGITFDEDAGRWYCLVEAAQAPDGRTRPAIDVLDASFVHLARRWLDFVCERENKGVEGVSTLRFRGEVLLLGLCEGNDCKGGSAGRKPGRGRIQVFRRPDDTSDGGLEHLDTIRLPASVRFEDYAALDVRDRIVTVVSQETSALWVGHLRDDPGSLADPFVDDGTTYLFPRDEGGRITYCHVEGLTWLPDGTLVAVSDRAKSGDKAGRCEHHDESIHHFRLPDPA